MSGTAAAANGECSRKRTRSSKPLHNEYNGFIPQAGSVIDVKGVAELKGDLNSFYVDYVQQRKPLKVCGGFIDGINPDNFTSSGLLRHLNYTGVLQVERKHESGYGLGYQRERMTMAQLFQEFERGNFNYYLTTQYNDNATSEYEEEQNESESGEEVDDSALGVHLADTSDATDDDSIDLDDLHDDYVDLDDEQIDDEDDSDYCRIADVIQPPLTKLALSNSETSPFPIVPEILPFLVPQQINLWVGANGRVSASDDRVPKVDLTREDLGLGRYVPRNGVSSGLHHDHSDNLYLLFQGWKRFTIYPPCNAHAMHTVGEVYKIYKTGIIDYNDNNWLHVRDDGAIIEDTKQNTGPKRTDEKGKCSTAPPSFSKIPPVFLHLDEVADSDQRHNLFKLLNEKYQQFLELPKMEVWLLPGEMLYLPAGWFHEVTSFSTDPKRGDHENNIGKGDGVGNVHIALNYWMAPPNGQSMQSPYSDSFWQDDLAKLKDALKRVTQRDGQSSSAPVV